MYELDAVYGRDAFDAWMAEPQIEDLRSCRRTATEVARAGAWPATSFEDLQRKVAFLSSMNKRLLLFYRGQRDDYPPLPQVYRNGWRCFDKPRSITDDNRRQYFELLVDIGKRVFEVCKNVGLPRWRGLRDIRELQWAIIQHYGLWPTPLVDMTTSLRTAASFALDGDAHQGYVYVFGMPELTGSITFNIDQHIVLARLQSCCPPSASRPHFQEGYLAGRFPVDADCVRSKAGLSNRLIARFVIPRAGFWTEHFPPVPFEARYPQSDSLADHFTKVFGSGGQMDLPLCSARLEQAVEKRPLTV